MGARTWQRRAARPCVPSSSPSGHHHGSHTRVAPPRRRLLALSDDTLKEYGIKAIGHRRQLRRYLQEDVELQVEAQAAREEQAKKLAAEKAKRGLRGISMKEEAAA